MTQDSANALREALAALGWSTGQLAALVGRNPRTARRWLDGSRPVPEHILRFLAASREALVADAGRIG